MRLLELSLRNYRVFDEVDLELPARVIGIFGPNGAGKSTLMESIEFGLYGRARTDKKQIRTHGVLIDAVVRLVFEHGGQQYEVRRTIRGKNHQTDAGLFVGDVQLAAGVTEVDAEIQRLLHMDHKVFRASVFAEQKQLDAFSEYRPAERKQMVLRLLGIRPVDEARTVARSRARDRKGDADRLAGALPDLDEERSRLSEAERERDEWSRLVGEARTALEEATVRAADAETVFEESDRIRERVDQIAVQRGTIEERAERDRRRHADLLARVERIDASLDELPALERERQEIRDAAKRLDLGRRLAEASGELAALREEVEALPAGDGAAARAELEAAASEREVARGAVARTRAEIEAAERAVLEAQETLARAEEADPTQPCPTCGRPLGDDFEEYVSHCHRSLTERTARADDARKAANEAAAAVAEAERRYRAAEAGAEEARGADERRGRIEHRFELADRKRRQLAEAFGEQEADVEALQAAAARAAEVDARLARLAADRDRLDEVRADAEEAATAVEDARTKLAALAEEEAGLSFDAEDHERRRKERDESRRLLDVARDREREAVERHGRAEAAVAELRGKIEEVERVATEALRLRDEARLLERVSGLLEGFRTFLYGRIVPQVSRDAEVLFRELTNHEYEDLRIEEDTLAIHIADGGQYFPLERFSGSESDLANLALRVAISQHLSRMAGADVAMMVLDEVLGALDAERKDLFVQAIGRLSGRLHQLFVVTHAEQVKDQFPASVEVRKVGRRRSQALLV
jgi:DNA repair protein SbcC/Rad50